MFKRIIQLSTIFILLSSVSASAINYRIYTNYVSDNLGLPKVKFRISETNSYSKPHQNEIWINTTDAVYITIFRRIAHEVYHIKQYKDNNEAFKGYTSSENDFDRYYNQKVEKDARNYSERILGRMIALKNKR